MLLVLGLLRVGLILDSNGFVVETHDHPSLSHLLTIERPNREGFVIRFEFSNLRVKVKHEDYKRLHRIITGVA